MLFAMQRGVVDGEARPGHHFSGLYLEAKSSQALLVHGEQNHA